ncbi:MAG: MetQ/NlpA family ABC transporter substrate-binding protein [Anaerolineales bacterium]|nr:MetQ/NlpA family ABC transporter substrate-binding protein [Anaerolineales bacterium]
MRLNRWLLAGLGMAALIALGACAPAAPQAPAEPATLRIAVLPILDNLPMYVAQQEGLFAEHGVTVEFIPVASAAERDQVIAAGQADGMINEVVSTLLYNRQDIQVQIVRFARVATPDSPQYHLLASAQSGFTSPQDLKDVEIGISQSTIIEYVTERLLEAEGLQPEEIKTLAVPKIPDRMALLSSGELKAATLPDPLSLLAIQQGAVVILDDTHNPQYSHSTYTFRKAFIDQNPEAIRGFLAAVEAATQLVNANPTQWDKLLSEQKLVPESVIGNYTMPVFPGNSVPDETLWNDVLSWVKGKGLVPGDVSYQDSVNPGFLPE